MVIEFQAGMGELPLLNINARKNIQNHFVV
ncbi:hypothetical protein SDC9_65853 [bioreactor metagenome]|uniref:Uncharacterized protein n=1 Tax=bioreactor metagenome TaxID=1076179 RepID=A0A644XTL2_9ZZZZ